MGLGPDLTETELRMTRLKFGYTRTRRVAERGFLWIDVENEQNDLEIVERLQEGEYARFLPLDQEFEDEDWTFNDVSDED